MILILGESHDPHVKNLAGELSALGVAVDVFNPAEVSISVSAQPKQDVEIHIAGEPIGKYRSVVCRSLPNYPSFGAGEEFRSEYVRGVALEGLVEAICEHLGAAVINPWISIQRHKLALYQIVTAQSAGFQTAPSVVTNDSDAIFKAMKNFGRLVIKPPIAEMIVPDSSGVSAENLTIYRIQSEDIKGSKSQIESAPLLYQKELDKKSDIRVAVFGESVFAYEINSQDYKSTELDWSNDLGFLTYKPIELDEEAIASIKIYTLKANLFEAHFDLVRTKDDQLFFVGCSPQGAWAWLDEQSSGALSRIYASELLSRINQ